MKILVVENDQRVAAPVTEAVERWGHQVETAGTGHDALKRVSQKRFDLVLLDLHLPDCRGRQLIPKFKELWPDTGVVTMTGHNTRELEREVRQQGILYYMIKPFGMEELKEILDHNSKKKRREMKRQWQN